MVEMLLYTAVNARRNFIYELMVGYFGERLLWNGIADGNMIVIDKSTDNL